MNGQERLVSVAFVISMLVIIGIAIVFSLLFSFYSFYKCKHINFGHEDSKLNLDLRKRYKNVIKNNELVEKDNPEYEYKLMGKTKYITSFIYTKSDNRDFDLKTSIVDSINKDNKKYKRAQMIMNVIFIFFYLILSSLLIVSITFRAQNENLFFGNTTYLTINTGSMEEINKKNTYLEEHNLNNQITQYSLIGISKVEKEEDLKLYDVVAYKEKESNLTIVHRIIRIYKNPQTNETFYTLKGDSNESSHSYELALTFEDIIGKYNGFNNYWLGITLIYLESNIGIIAISTAFLFLLISNIIEDVIGKTYQKRILIVAKKVDEEVIEEMKEDARNS